jgi:hypothetical protein
VEEVAARVMVTVVAKVIARAEDIEREGPDTMKQGPRSLPLPALNLDGDLWAVCGVSRRG